MTWDYAKHSHEVSEAGGVDAYVAQLYKVGHDSGLEEGILYITIAVGLATVAIPLFKKGIQKIKTYQVSKKLSQIEGENENNEQIQGSHDSF
ncbi:hypothetical protein [Lactococcus hircilactis]|uniref:hypothetical protein n=1 Tax=Lactococcus hircilactis TaxID=1494462 RepID=UPI003FA218E7